ncbi:unnamed protein product [Boreogadus saida]
MTDASDPLHSQLTDSGSHDTPAQPEWECEISPRGVQEFCGTVVPGLARIHHNVKPSYTETLARARLGGG